MSGKSNSLTNNHHAAMPKTINVNGQTISTPVKEDTSAIYIPDHNQHGCASWLDKIEFTDPNSGKTISLSATTGIGALRAVAAFFNADISAWEGKGYSIKKLLQAANDIVLSLNYSPITIIYKNKSKKTLGSKISQPGCFKRIGNVAGSGKGAAGAEATLFDQVKEGGAVENNATGKACTDGAGDARLDEVRSIRNEIHDMHFMTHEERCQKLESLSCEQAAKEKGERIVKEMCRLLNLPPVEGEELIEVARNLGINVQRSMDPDQGKVAYSMIDKRYVSFIKEEADALKAEDMFQLCINAGFGNITNFDNLEKFESLPWHVLRLPYKLGKKMDIKQYLENLRKSNKLSVDGIMEQCKADLEAGHLTKTNCNAILGYYLITTGYSFDAGKKDLDRLEKFSMILFGKETTEMLFDDDYITPDLPGAYGSAVAKRIRKDQDKLHNMTKKGLQPADMNEGKDKGVTCVGNCSCCANSAGCSANSGWTLEYSLGELSDDEKSLGAEQSETPNAPATPIDTEAANLNADQNILKQADKDENRCTIADPSAPPLSDGTGPSDPASARVKELKDITKRLKMNFVVKNGELFDVEDLNSFPVSARGVFWRYCRKALRDDDFVKSWDSIDIAFTMLEEWRIRWNDEAIVNPKSRFFAAETFCDIAEKIGFSVVPANVNRYEPTAAYGCVGIPKGIKVGPTQLLTAYVEKQLSEHSLEKDNGNNFNINDKKYLDVVKRVEDVKKVLRIWQCVYKGFKFGSDAGSSENKMGGNTELAAAIELVSIANKFNINAYVINSKPVAGKGWMYVDEGEEVGATQIYEFYEGSSLYLCKSLTAAYLRNEIVGNTLNAWRNKYDGINFGKDKKIDEPKDKPKGWDANAYKKIAEKAGVKVDADPPSNADKPNVPVEGDKTKTKPPVYPWTDKPQKPFDDPLFYFKPRPESCKHCEDYKVAGSDACDDCDKWDDGSKEWYEQHKDTLEPEPKGPFTPCEAWLWADNGFPKKKDYEAKCPSCIARGMPKLCEAMKKKSVGAKLRKYRREREERLMPNRGFMKGRLVHGNSHFLSGCPSCGMWVDEFALFGGAPSCTLGVPCKDCPKEGEPCKVAGSCSCEQCPCNQPPIKESEAPAPVASAVKETKWSIRAMREVDGEDATEVWIRVSPETIKKLKGEL